MNVQPHSQLLNAWKTRPPADPLREKQIREQTPGWSDLRPGDLLTDGLYGFIDGASLIIGPGAAYIPAFALGCAGATLGLGGAVAGAALGFGAVVYTAMEKAFPGYQPTTRGDLRHSQADLVGDKLREFVSDRYTVLQSGDRQMILNTNYGEGRAVFEGADGKPVEIYCRRGIQSDSPYNMFGQNKPNYVPGFSMRGITADGDIYTVRKKGDECVVKGPGLAKTVFRVVGDSSEGP